MNDKPGSVDGELKYYGLNAAMALFKNSPEKIIRIYLTQTNVKRCSAMLSWAAKQKLAYHIVESKVLEKVSGSVHHEGIMILGRPPAIGSESELFHVIKGADHKSPNSLRCILFLDGVSNSHNVGAIIRTAAHFAIGTVCIAENGSKVKDESHRLITPSLCRVAEGGVEFVSFFRVASRKKCLEQLKRFGYQIFVTSGREGCRSIYDLTITNKIVVVMGNEIKGVSRSALELADDICGIPGSGYVESMNVSASCAVILAQLRKRYPIS